MPRLRYGVNWDDKYNDLHIELLSFRDGTKCRGGDPDNKPFHFKNVVKMLWGPKSKKPFVWNPWCDKMLRHACEEQYLWLSGCAACVSGDTRILNPITGEQPTIKSLCDGKISPTVQTLFGPAQATVPFVKGFERLYEFKLNNGASFKCSGEHLLLTERGFVRALAVTEGQSLYGYDQALRGSISDNDPSTREQDVPSYQKIVEGFQGSYWPDSCPGGEQLLPAREASLASFPSRDDVQKRSSCACDDGGGFGREFLYTHLRQSFSHPSTVRSDLRLATPQISFERLGAAGMPIRDGHSFLPYAPSQQGYIPFHTYTKDAPCESGKPTLGGFVQSSGWKFHSPSAPVAPSPSSHPVCSPSPECYRTTGTIQPEDRPVPSSEVSSYVSRVSRLRVVSIRRTEKQWFYDLTVPGIHHYFAEGAIHHNSGKSTFGAMWGLISWLCSPTKTLVLFTSTGLEDARRRVWGEVESLFMAGCESMNSQTKGATLPGRIISSTGKIRTQDGDQKFSDRCGCQLIAGDRAKEKENIGKLIGAHNNRVILVADELTELSPALVDAARSNLVVNPHFQMIGMGNFASIYDPFGVNAEPIGGWGSVTPDYDEWRTKDGLCLRFDGLKSPNILAGEDKYPGQYSASHLAKHRDSFGENTALFWRMCRSFPCPEADQDRIYSEADLIKGDARGSVLWQGAPVKCAALDPAFATGGDRAMAYFGLLGIAIDGKQTLQVVERKELREDIRKKDENRALQVAKLYIAECQSRGITPENAAYDGSGGGIVFGSLLSELWSNKPLGVQFGGAASERPASVKDSRPSKDAFANRVAEIWFAGVDFVQSGQIKGLPNQCCMELTERRKMIAKKGSVGIKNRIESKDDMKKRTGGKSPDDADGFLILLELCRMRLNFKAVGMEGKRADIGISWKRRVLLANKIYKNANYEPEAVAA